MGDYPPLWAAVSGNWPDIVFAMSVSMIAGGIAYFRRLQRYRPRMFSIHEFVSYILSSMVAGFILIMVCAELTTSGRLRVSPWALSALIPVAGAIAPWGLELLNQAAIKRWKRMLDLENGDDPPTS